jgi:hypothetical protein
MMDVLGCDFSSPVFVFVVGLNPFCMSTRRAGALRRARLLPVFAPCLLMRPTNPFLIRLIVSFHATKLIGESGTQRA